MGMQITENDRGFYIKFPYDEKMVASVKSIGRGTVFKGKDIGWFVPRYMEHAVESLKREYGVMVNPEIEMPEQIGIIDPMPELTIEIPLKRPLFKFQENDVARGMELKRFINANEPGLGKSSDAIATAIALDCKCILVVCPNSLKLNWKNEFMLVAGMRSMEISVDNRTSWQRYYEVGMCNVFIINYDSLKNYFVLPGWKKPDREFRLNEIPFRDSKNLFDCIICDESHALKNGETMWSRVARGICWNKPVVQLLTGTPVINKPKDLAHQLMVLGKLLDIVSHIPDKKDKWGKWEDPTGYTRFLNRYCEGGAGKSNLKELNYRLNKYCFFRNEKKDVLKDLPDKQRQIYECEITNMAEYKKCERDFIEYLRQVKGQKIDGDTKSVKGQTLMKMNALRQIAAKGKLDAAKQYIDSIVESENKIVVFAYHEAITNELLKIYPDAVSIVGKDSNLQRDNNTKKFQTKEDVNKMICSIKAGGVGHNLTAASYALLVEIGMTDAIIDQCIDRLHRIGQVNKVLATLLLGKKTVDMYVYYKIVLPKREMAKQITGSSDGEPDVEINVDDLLNFFANNNEI